MFEASPEVSKKLKPRLEAMAKKKLKTGVTFLDDALGAILSNDLLVVGAPSGAGKTQFCVNLALSNIEDGKKVFFVALEAFYGEIQARLHYEHIAKLYFSDPKRSALEKNLNFRNWLLKELGPRIETYEEQAEKFCETAFKDLFMLYKQEKFNVSSLIEAMLHAKEHADIVIVDHIHYFDWGDENDNKAVREIVMTARDLVLENDIPICLVSHLRKKDRYVKDLCAGADEFHGSSDLFKVSSKAFTIAPGGPAEDGQSFYTYMRPLKSRVDGSCNRYLGRTKYNYRGGFYESKYDIGWANAEKFGCIDNGQVPDWARSSGNLRPDAGVPEGQSQPSKNKSRPRALRKYALGNQDD